MWSLPAWSYTTNEFFSQLFTKEFWSVFKTDFLEHLLLNNYLLCLLILTFVEVFSFF